VSLCPGTERRRSWLQRIFSRDDVKGGAAAAATSGQERELAEPQVNVRASLLAREMLC
jgi:hypothetical protein